MFIDLQIDDQITLRNPGHSNKTLTSLAQLRKDNVLCDAVIIVEDKTFNVHKNVLASCSEYFRIMFSTSLTKTDQKEHSIGTISSEVFEEILEYMYNGCFNLDMISVLDMIHAASLLLMKEIVAECFKYLRRNLDINNCLRVQRIAEAYNDKDLLKDSSVFILKHFEELVKGKEILNMSFKHIHRLLANNTISCKAEETVVSLLRNWLALRNDISVNEVRLLLKCVRIPFVDNAGIESLESILKDLDSKKSCQNEFLKAFQTEQKIQCRKKRRKHIERRLSQKSAYVIFCVSRSGETFCYDLESKRFRALERLPEIIQPAQLVVNDNIVYGIGATNTPSLLQDINYSASLYSYNPNDNKWTRLPSMLYPRTSHGAAFLHGKLYVIGGKSSTPENTGRSVECYDPMTATWSHVTSTSVPRIRSAVTASTRHVYAIGGASDNLFSGSVSFADGLDSAERYCPRKNKWEKLPNLHHKRMGSSAIYFNHKLYVFGGGNGIFDLRNFEYLNPTEKQWIVVSIPYTTPISVALAMNDKVIALGHSSWGDELALTNSFARRSGLSWRVITDFIHSSHRVRCMNYAVINMTNYDIDRKSEGHCVCYEESESNMEETSSDSDDYERWLDPDPWGMWL